MAEAITIKKKKLQIKSKASVQAAKDEAAQDATPQDTPPPSPTPDEPLPGVFGRSAIPESDEKGPSYTLYVILAVITFLMFVGILVIQCYEWSFLNSAFPHPIQTAPISAP